MVVPPPSNHSSSRRETSAAQDENQWVDFDSASFQASKRKKKKKVISKSSAQGRQHQTANSNSRSDESVSVTPSWMQRPVNSDASWMPIAPPSRSSTASSISETRDDVTDKREVLSPTPSRGSLRQLPPGVSPTWSPAPTRKSLRQFPPAVGSPSSASRKSLGRPPRRSDSNNASSSDSSTSDVKRRSRGRAQDSNTRRSRSHSQASRRSTTSAPVLVRPSEDIERGSRGRTRTMDEAPRGQGASQRSRSTSRARAPSSRSSSTTTPVTSNPGNPGRGRSTSQAPERRDRSASRTPRHHVEGGGQRSQQHSSSSVGPGLPRPRPRRPSTTLRATSDEYPMLNIRTAGDDTNIGREVHFGTTARSQGPASLPSPRKEGGLMEKLFGDQVNGEAARSQYKSPSTPTVLAELPSQTHSRILLSATVYHNTATNLWITTVNTNQKGVPTNPSTAAKFLKAFSFATEKEARESAIANAPPKMLPFKDKETCFICQGKFAVFRRPSHCRNCGVCICNSCTTTWPSKAIPGTYNLKKEKRVKVCMSCDWLSQAFKQALLKGDYQETMTLYGTGNINLRSPFNIPKSESSNSEAMYPIHCAVEGGNLSIVRWLVEERYCPIKRVSTSNGKKKRAMNTPITTSKGHSALFFALTNRNIPILRYLVVEKGVSVLEIKDLNLSLQALEAALTAVPHTNAPLQSYEMVTRWTGAEEDYDGESDISGSFVDSSPYYDEDESTIESRHSNDQDVCIICYDNAIDCVMTPCGHQICCLKCAHNMSTCPVCNLSCEYIRIFKP